MIQYPTTPLGFLWYYVRQKKKDNFLFLLLMATSTICARLVLYYFSNMIDILNEAVKNNQTWEYSLGLVITTMILLDILFIIFKRWAFEYDLRMTPWMAMKVEKDVSNYLMGHSARFLANQTSGKLAGRAGQLSNDLDNMLGMIEFDFFIPSISAIITFSMLCWVNWWCGLLFLFWTVILCLVFKKYAHRLREISKDHSEKKANIVGRIVDIVANALTVKGFSNQSFEEKTLHPFLVARKKALEKLIIMHQNIQVAQNLTISFFRLSMIILSVFLWQQGKVSAGNIVLTLLLVNTMVEIKVIVNIYGTNQMKKSKMIQNQ